MKKALILISTLLFQVFIAPKNDREKALQSLEFAKSIQGKSVFFAQRTE